MSEKYKVYEGGLFFVTLTVAGWIDVFTRNDYADFVEANLNYCVKNKGLNVYAYCIMPSHVHLIASSEKGLVTSILRDFKSYTSKKLIEMIANHPAESRKEWMLYLFEFHANKIKHNSQFNFWKQNNHPIDLWNPEITRRTMDYIHNNPVEAKLVNAPENYIYSSVNPGCGVNLSVL